MESRTQRSRKVPAKLRDNAMPVERLVSANVWCTVLLDNHQEEIVHSQKLESETGEPLTLRYLTPGAKVLWNYKGTPYSVEILSVAKERPGKPTYKQPRKLYPEDSDDTDSDGEAATEQPTHNRKEKAAGTSKGVKRGSDGEAVTSEPKHPSYKGKEKAAGTSKGVKRGSAPGHGKRSKFPKIVVSSDSEFENAAVEEKSGQYGDDSDEDSTVRKAHKDIGKIGFSVPFVDDTTTETMTQIMDTLKVHTGLLQDLDKKLSKIMRHLAATAGSQDRGSSQQTRRPLTPLNAVKCEQPPNLVKCEQPPNLVKCEQPPNLVKCEQQDEPEERFITENGINLLKIRAVEPTKYALALMDVIFTEEELANCCYESNKRTTKPGLPGGKVQLLEECVSRKFGGAAVHENALLIKKKCNQKCIDRANRNKKL